jgi:hypothetical protein
MYFASTSRRRVQGFNQAREGMTTAKEDVQRIHGVPDVSLSGATDSIAPRDDVQWIGLRMRRQPRTGLAIAAPTGARINTR